ncbi:MAG: VWA domain-containing protein [Deltaproteobacteria bacterium]|nr:VWA domain-containing protein [Deltaproteobacteria bacterium]
MFTGLLGIAGFAAAGPAEPVGELEVEIYEPAPEARLRMQRFEPDVLIEGGASIFGGVRQLDLFLVMDSSKSLLRTDARDHRVEGAVGLVASLPEKSDLQIGVVDFDRKAKLVQPLTSDRRQVTAALRGLDRKGSTNLAAGIQSALAGFEAGARPGSSRVILLFTDGKSNEDKARAAMREARAAGVAIHTLLLGSDEDGQLLLDDIASGTGGSFIHVTDPAELPAAFLNLRTTGVETVTLRVNGGAPIPTELSGGAFSTRVPYQMGANTVVATATSLDGRLRQQSVTFYVESPLRIVIEDPLDGALLEEPTREIHVAGQVVTFDDVPEEHRMAHPNLGVQMVTLQVNDLPPFLAQLERGRFRGRVLLEEGENHIVATATNTAGQTAMAAITLTARPPGCAELEVRAERDGEPALSISDRAVEIVFDASNSMWARIDGQPKISIAKHSLQALLDWMPADLRLALRVYGHQHSREKKDCQDSQLLVGFGAGNRTQVRQSIAGFQPRGQTPLAYSLSQTASDFGAFRGERAVVLVTDGIESCGGDPVQAARDLQRDGDVPVHVIGFGLGGDATDTGSLRAIAEASGGRYMSARNAEELRDALRDTIGTAFRVLREQELMASGTLGARQRFRLPAGSYMVHVDSEPPQQLRVTLGAEEGTTLLLRRDDSGLSRSESRWAVGYAHCEERGPAMSLPAAPAHTVD